MSCFFFCYVVKTPPGSVRIVADCGLYACQVTKKIRRVTTIEFTFLWSAAGRRPGRGILGWCSGLANGLTEHLHRRKSLFISHSNPKYSMFRNCYQSVHDWNCQL